MKQHDLCWEEAIRALAVSRAVDQLAKETAGSVMAAVEQLTERLRRADLCQRTTDLVSLTTTVSRRPRKPVRAGKLPVEPATATTTTITTTTREGTTTKREKRDPVVETTLSAMLPIPTEITASIPSEITTAEDTKAKTTTTATKASLRKRPTDSTSSVSSSKPETTSRKSTRKRSRELEDECSAKRPC